MKAKRRALIPALLSGILALGLLARSSTRLAMDLLYPFSTADTAAHELRIFWKQLGEGICGALYAVYLLGMLVLLCLAWSGKLRVRCSSSPREAWRFYAPSPLLGWTVTLSSTTFSLYGNCAPACCCSFCSMEPRH